MTETEKILKLREFIKSHFTHHYECDDNFYGCPKSEGYFGPDSRDKCYCGKDDADVLLEETL
jgi:hypothetical protein